MIPNGNSIIIIHSDMKYDYDSGLAPILKDKITLKLFK